MCIQTFGCVLSSLLSTGRQILHALRLEAVQELGDSVPVPLGPATSCLLQYFSSPHNRESGGYKQFLKSKGCCVTKRNRMSSRMRCLSMSARLVGGASRTTCGTSVFAEGMITSGPRDCT
ncbi:hypothetical protein C8Q72DRAFT_256406 [Fomitopsis betulina]|nr:hypothetical protein C8Q72DRAFT_256406 [Fomitopsis betulina]